MHVAIGLVGFGISLTHGARHACAHDSFGVAAMHENSALHRQQVSAVPLNGCGHVLNVLSDDEECSSCREPQGSAALAWPGGLYPSVIHMEYRQPGGALKSAVCPCSILG